MITKNFSKEELQLISRAINCFGEGDHPCAESSQESIQYFKKNYIDECLIKALPNMSNKGKSIAKEILGKQ